MRKKGSPVQDSLYCYSVSTGDLTSSPIARTYGVKNLYKNIKNQTSVHEIEKKLSFLETHAGRSISELLGVVETRAKDAADPVVFRIKRRYLNYLRRFMFVMYYRKDGYKELYFQEDHHQNIGASSWIRNFREQNGLEPSEIWLHILGYYLDTPHSDLIAHGKSAADNSMKANGFTNRLLGGQLDPNLKHFEAVAYYGEATGFFLNIWEAAEGEEFVISSNSFGLIEGISSNMMSRGTIPGGTIPGGTPITLHKFYVVSPKIVLVLCSVYLKPEFPRPPDMEREFSQSILWGAPHKSPIVCNSHGAPVQRNGLSQNPFTFEDDVLEFEILQLSAEFTHKVNAVLLGNVRGTGLLTFHSKPAVLRTLEAFSRNRDHSNQSAYEPLVAQLLSETGGSSSFKVVPNPCPTSITIDHNTRMPLTAMREQQVPNKPHIATAAAASPAATPSGIYHSALQIYLGLTSPPTESYLQHKELVLHAALGIPLRRGDANPRPARLVANLDDPTATFLFVFVRHSIGGLGISQTLACPGAIALALLDWLLHHRRSLFTKLEDQLPFMIKEYEDVSNPPLANCGVANGVPVRVGVRRAEQTGLVFAGWRYAWCIISSVAI